MWVIYIIAIVLVLMFVGMIQDKFQQRKNEQEKNERIKRNFQTGEYDHKKEIFYNLFALNTGGNDSKYYKSEYLFENGKTGFADNSNKVITSQKFDAVRLFKGGFAVTTIDKKYGLYCYHNHQGYELAPCVFEYFEEKKNSIRVWSNSKQTKSNNILYSQSRLGVLYNSIQTYDHNNIITATKSNITSIINIENFKTIFEIKDADVVLESDFIISNKSNKKQIYNLEGDLLIDDYFDSIEIITDYPGGLTRPKQYYFYCTKDIGYKIIYDIAGHHSNDYKIKKIKYESFPHSHNTKFTSNIFLCENSVGKWGGINQNLDLLIDFIYDEILIYRDYICLKNAMGFYTYYYDDLLGPFDKIESYSKSLLLFSKDKFKIFNIWGGYKILSEEYELYEKISGSYDLYKIKCNNKFGLYSKDFHQYFAPCYDDIISYQSEKCICLNNGKFGVVDSLNNILLPFQYSNIDSIENDWLEYCKNQIIENPEKSFKYIDYLPKKKELKRLDAKDNRFPTFKNGNEEYLFLDTEVNGYIKSIDMPIEMSDYWPRIFQLSWLITDQNGIILKEKNCLIKPVDFIIPNEMAERHGITTDVARKFGTNLNVVLLELLKDIQSAKAIVGHNINYDMKVICAEFYRLNYNFIYNEKKIYCTMKSGIFISEMNKKWPKLQELHKELFGHEFQGAHNAMSDVTATKVCFWEMVKQHKIFIFDKSEDEITTDLPF